MKNVAGIGRRAALLAAQTATPEAVNNLVSDIHWRFSIRTVHRFNIVVDFVSPYAIQLRNHTMIGQRMTIAYEDA